jgi:MerR family mercuric resistance operon transcriptional regulator
MMAVQHFSIGDLSKRTGVNIETIRYYEKIEIMPVPPRTRGGHRSYGAEHAKRLLFISRSRSLGFSLQEIRSLLGIADGHDITCADVRKLTLRHAEEARRKIADLKKLERTLRDMAAQCHGNRAPDCPIVDTLFDGGGVV